MACSPPPDVQCEPTGQDATAIVSIDPVADTGSILFSIPDTGPSGPRVGSVIVDPGGGLIVNTTNGVLQLDPVTGATLDTLAVFPWTFGPGGEPYASRWDPTEPEVAHIVQLDLETGQETVVATLTAPAGGSAAVNGFGVEPDGDTSPRRPSTCPRRTCRAPSCGSIATPERWTCSAQRASRASSLPIS
jgi:hypothetical protein